MVRLHSDNELFFQLLLNASEYNCQYESFLESHQSFTVNKVKEFEHSKQILLLDRENRIKDKSLTFIELKCMADCNAY